MLTILEAATSRCPHISKGLISGGSAGLRSIGPLVIGVIRVNLDTSRGLRTPARRKRSWQKILNGDGKTKETTNRGATFLSCVCMGSPLSFSSHWNYEFLCEKDDEQGHCVSSNGEETNEGTPRQISLQVPSNYSSLVIWVRGPTQRVKVEVQ